MQVQKLCLRRAAPLGGREAVQARGLLFHSRRKETVQGKDDRMQEIPIIKRETIYLERLSRLFLVFNAYYATKAHSTFKESNVDCSTQFETTPAPFLSSPNIHYSRWISTTRDHHRLAPWPSSTRVKKLTSGTKGATGRSQTSPCSASSAVRRLTALQHMKPPCLGTQKLNKKTLIFCVSCLLYIPDEMYLRFFRSPK